jgi:membrane protease YdiL (CAAX protease family)
MKWVLALGFTLVFLALVLMVVPALSSSAWAQAPSTPASGAGTKSAATIIGIVVALLVIIGAGVKLLDLKRKREDEAVRLQAQLSDALLREPGLAGLALTATARVATFASSPPVVEISGWVPTQEARERALNILRGEAARLRPDVQLEDRIGVVPTIVQRAS